MPKTKVRLAYQKVVAVIDQERMGFVPADDKELLEEISTQIEGYLDCLKEENPELS